MGRVNQIKPDTDANNIKPAGNSELDSIKSILIGEYAKEVDQKIKALEVSLEKQSQESKRALAELSLSVTAINEAKLDTDKAATLFSDVSDSLRKGS